MNRLGLATLLWTGVAVSAASTPVTATTATAGPPIQVDGGLIQGSVGSHGVQEYLGVPYAAAPVGQLRWREPQPVPAWAGTRPAVSFGASCMQAKQPAGQPAMSEDCLFLNLWAPRRARSGDSFPVVVYIHGAGFNTNSASQPTLRGEALARHGLVVVTFNYRLGVLGGLALPELTAESSHHSSGAYSHLDELAALRWVQRNISRFGGNPRNVTLMGQSSGSIDVSILQASPLARGLFERVLALSGAGVMHGGAWPGWTLSEAEKHGQEVEAVLGVHSLAELRELSSTSIIEHASFYFPAGADGYVLPAHPAEIFASGRQNDVSIFIGNTRDEGFSSIASVKSLAEYEEAVHRLSPEGSDQLLKLYPATSDDEAIRQARLLANEAEFQRQMTQWARLQAASGKSPAYLFRFVAPEGPSPHGRDVAYWFGTLDQLGAVTPQRFPAPSAADQELSRQMVNLLVSYAKGGPPVTGDLEAPRYERRAEKLIQLGRPVETKALDQGVDYLLEHPELVIGIGEPGLNPTRIQ